MNGVVYRSIDEVPEGLRPMVAGLLTDADGDGVPDIVQHGPDSASSVTSVRSETFIVDGVASSSLDEMPERHRETIAHLSERAVTRTPSRATPSRPAEIVTTAGPSRRTKALIAFMAFDVVVVGAVAWLLLR